MGLLNPDGFWPWPEGSPPEGGERLYLADAAMEEAIAGYRHDRAQVLAREQYEQLKTAQRAFDDACERQRAAYLDEELGPELEELQSKKLAPATKRAYEAARQKYDEYHRERRSEWETAWPPRDAGLALYLMHVLSLGGSYASLRQIVAALQDACASAGVADPAGPYVRAVLRFARPGGRWWATATAERAASVEETQAGG
jgi:hypothetical protein